jgi:hypothetical protein
MHLPGSSPFPYTWGERQRPRTIDDVNALDSLGPTFFHPIPPAN